MDIINNWYNTPKIDSYLEKYYSSIENQECYTLKVPSKSKKDLWENKKYLIKEEEEKEKLISLVLGNNSWESFIVTIQLYPNIERLIELIIKGFKLSKTYNYYSEYSFPVLKNIHYKYSILEFYYSRDMESVIPETNDRYFRWIKREPLVILEENTISNYFFYSYEDIRNKLFTIIKKYLPNDRS